MKICKKCNVDIGSKHKNAKFCSVKCRNDFFNSPATKESRECTNCNKEFISKRKDQIYCSKYCADYYSKFLRKDEINKYFKDLYNNNISRRLSTNIRSRLNKAIKGVYKVDSIIGNLGCSPEQLVEYLEDQFTEGMTWDNYGLHGWHMDHIKPLASFDLSEEKEFKEACHYTNLQPLWAKDNLSKGDKFGE